MRPRGAAAQFLRQLDALGLAARKRRGGLAELEIAQADVGQHLEARDGGGHIREQRQGFLDGQIEDLGDIVVAVAHGERLAGEAAAVAGRAAHFRIGQEVAS